MCPGFLNFFCDLLFVSISLWHFEAGRNNLVLQHIINRSFYDVLVLRFLNQAKMIQHFASLSFSSVGAIFDFPVAVLCFRLPVSNTKCDFNEFRKIRHLLATSVFKVAAE